MSCVVVTGCPVKSIPIPLLRPCPLIEESWLYVYGVGSKSLGLKPSFLDQDPLINDCFLADRLRSPKMIAMMRTTRQPMTIPAIAPVDSLGLFLAAWLAPLSGISGTDDVMDGLIMDSEGLVGESETVGGDGDTVEIGARVVVAEEDGKSPVDIVSAGTLIVCGEGEAVTNVVVVIGEGMSGVFVAIGVRTTVTVNVTGAVNWPSSPNCLSVNVRPAL